MKKLFTAVTAAVFIVNFAFCSCVGAVGLDEAMLGGAKYISTSAPNPAVSAVGGEWAVFALARSGQDIDGAYGKKYYENLLQYLDECGGVLSERKYTEYSRVILALTAIGKDAENVGGYNLTAPLCDCEKVIRQGVNGAIWALIALDCGAYNPPGNVWEVRERYVKYILSCTLQGGGWAISGKNVECDVTAMALVALKNYLYCEGVGEAVEEALAALSRMQEADGGFSSYGEENAESAAQVVTALSALGIALDDEAFVKNGQTALDNLLSFYTDGSFAHTKGGEASLMATEQALYALAAVRLAENGQGLFDMGASYTAIGKIIEKAFDTAKKVG